ncbi:hypothetical protein ACS3SW_07330 [Roseobacteraceae bacterium S113]
MAIDLMMLHTSDAHIATFNSLRNAYAPGARIEHTVRADWLARARREGLTWQLKREIDVFVRNSDAPVMCTCSTLGDAAELAGALRVDRPMMERAAATNRTVLLVCALESTAAPSLALLEEAKSARGNDHAIVPLVLEQFWPIFTGGDAAGFHAAIAAAVIEALNARRDIGAVVLSQVSMAGAAHLLDGCGVQVLAAPDLAIRNSLRAQARESLGEPMTM